MEEVIKYKEGQTILKVGDIVCFNNGDKKVIRYISSNHYVEFSDASKCDLLIYEDMIKGIISTKKEVSAISLDIPTKDIDPLYEYRKVMYQDKKRFFKEDMKYIPKECFKSDITKIKEELKRRGITKLIHFSPVWNTRSILEHGLLSRKELENKNIRYCYTDINRMDNLLDFISLSISKENISMKINKMINNHICSSGVEIFEIDPSILYEHIEDVIYCSTNAARKDSSIYMDFGYQGFKELFNPLTDSKYTNSESAEILIRGHIDKKYIIGHYYLPCINTLQ